jgi:hypothetical protein
MARCPRWGSAATERLARVRKADIRYRLLWVVSSTGRRNTLPFETEVGCDAATTEATLLHGGRERRDLGPVAEGRRAQVDRPGLWQELRLDLLAH